MLWSAYFVAGVATGMGLGMAIMYLADAYLPDIDPEKGGVL